MGLLAFPAMLKAGYSIRLSAGVVTAGGTLGILIPPSVLLILYGATAGVSVMQLYAGAFFPGLMLAGLYIGDIIIYAKLKPSTAPPLSEEDRRVELPKFAEEISRDGSNVVVGLIGAIKGKRNTDVPRPTLLRHLGIALLPGLAAVLFLGSIYLGVTAPKEVVPESVIEMGMGATDQDTQDRARELQEPGRSRGTAGTGRSRGAAGTAGCRRRAGARRNGEGGGPGKGRRPREGARTPAPPDVVLDRLWSLPGERRALLCVSSTSPGSRSSGCCWGRSSRWRS